MTIINKTFEFNSTRLKVYEDLKKKIINNILKPMEILNERILAKEYNISKTPVREALQQLELNNFVGRIPNKGWFVSGIYLEHIKEVFEIREILECAAARISAVKRNKDSFIKLKNKFESSEIENEKSAKSMLLAGDKIHNLVIEETGNSRLVNIYKSELEHVIKIRMYFLDKFERERLIKANSEHLEILNAMIKGDPGRAEEVIRNHLRNAKEYIIKLI